MAAKKVIEIDVQDGAFKRFAAAFDAFSQALKKSPDEIKALNKAVEAGATAAAKGADKETEAVKKRTAAKKTESTADAATSKRKDEDRKKDEKREREQIDAANKQATLRKKNREEDSKAARDLAKWTADIAWNTGKAALSFAKWATIGGITTGFGFGALASGASNARRQSQGLGIDSGELRAAQVNFGKYINPETMLDNIANAKSSFGGQNLFGRFGVNPNGKDPAALLAEMLPKMVDAFNRVGGMEEPAKAMGLLDFASMAELRRLSGLPKGELSATIGRYQTDRANLHVEDEDNRQWQSFLVSLHRAGQTIETSLIKHLAVLAPKLENFAKAISTALDTFLKNHDLSKWLDTFATGIEKVATFLGSNEFQSDIGKFMHAMHKVATFLGKVFDDDPDPMSPAAHPDMKPVGKWAAAGHVYGALWDHLMGNDSEKAKRVGSLEGQYKLPKGLLDTVWALESARGANNSVSSAGAGGDFQIIPGVAAGYGVKDRWNFSQASDAAARMLRDLLKHYGGDAQKALAGYNWGMGNLDKDIAAHGKDWRQFVPRETASYLDRSNIKVVIENNTGGNAQTTVAALAH